MKSVPPTEGDDNPESAEQVRRRKLDVAARALSDLGWPGHAINDLLEQWGEGWAPSEEAIIAGRVLDGAARTSWELVAAATTDEDLKRSAKLIGAISDACRAGDRDQLDRLEGAARAFSGLPSLDEDRRAHLLGWITAVADYWHDGTTIGGTQLIETLTEIDGGFAALDPEQVQTAIATLVHEDKTSAREHKSSARHTGSEWKRWSRRGPVDLAAKLAVEARVFGLGARRGETQADAVLRAKSALKTARRRGG